MFLTNGEENWRTSVQSEFVVNYDATILSAFVIYAADYDNIDNFRSTPMLDEIYGGDDGLTAALGYEEGEFTTILFRKKLDCKFSSELPFVQYL